MAQPNTGSCIGAKEISELQQRCWKQVAGKEEGTVAAQLSFLTETYQGMASLPQTFQDANSPAAQMVCLGSQKCSTIFFLYTLFSHHRCIKR